MFSEHAGSLKIRMRIPACRYWPGLTKSVAQWCKLCEVCQKKQVYRVKDRAPLRPIVMEGPVWSDVQVDVMGGDLSGSRSGKRYCLVISSVQSRWSI